MQTSHWSWRDAICHVAQRTWQNRRELAQTSTPIDERVNNCHVIGLVGPVICAAIRDLETILSKLQVSLFIVHATEKLKFECSHYPRICLKRICLKGVYNFQALPSQFLSVEVLSLHLSFGWTRCPKVNQLCPPCLWLITASYLVTVCCRLQDAEQSPFLCVDDTSRAKAVFLSPASNFRLCTLPLECSFWAHFACQITVLRHIFL